MDGRAKPASTRTGRAADVRCGRVWALVSFGLSALLASSCSHASAASTTQKQVRPSSMVRPTSGPVNPHPELVHLQLRALTARPKAPESLVIAAFSSGGGYGSVTRVVWGDKSTILSPDSVACPARPVIAKPSFSKTLSHRFRKAGVYEATVTVVFSCGRIPASRSATTRVSITN